MPPSTLSDAIGTPVSATIASSTSRVCQAVDSSAARARWPRFTNRVRPTITPRASLRQYGANRPENAGTNTTPPLSSTDRASASTSSADRIRPRLSRSHWTTAPAMAVEPSRAYVAGEEPSRQATVVSRPEVEGTICSPVLTSMKQPVP